MTRSAAILSAGVAVAIVLGATACTGATTSSSPSGGTSAGRTVSAVPSAPPASRPSVVPTPVAPPGATATADATPATPPHAESPHRRLRGSFEGVAVVAEVYPIRRLGSTSVANVRFVAVNASRTFRILEALNDHNPEVGDGGDTSPDGLRLIDPQAEKAYLPATISDHECLCSPARNAWTDRYTDVTVTVAFAAPPATMETIHLLVPGFGTVTDVPLR